MPDMHDFENRFAERLRAYAAPAARRPSPEAVSKAVDAAKLGQGGGLTWPRTRRRPRIWMLAAALLLLGLIGGGLAGSLLLRDDDSRIVPPATVGGIAYQTAGSDSHLALVDPTTGQSRALTPPLTELLGSRGCQRQPVEEPLVLEMAWSPDGGALVFQLAAGVHLNSTNKVRCGLLVVSSDGTTLQTLLPPRGQPDRRLPEHHSPSWAPDGSHLAVALERSIALLALDGSPPVDLSSPCEDCTPTYWDAIGGWSPDGTRIAAQFTNDQSAAGPLPIIAVVDVASGTWTILSEFVGGEGDVAPKLRGWLPDGTVAADSAEGVHSLDPDRPGASTLLPFSEPLGTWSPDKTRDVLKPEREGDGLRVRELSGGEITTIADWDEPDATIAWSSYGAQLAVLRNRSEIWVIGADGSDPSRLVNNAGVPTGPITRQPYFHVPITWQPVGPSSEEER